MKRSTFSMTKTNESARLVPIHPQVLTPELVAWVVDILGPKV